MSKANEYFEDNEKQDVTSVVVEELCGPPTPASRLDSIYRSFTAWIFEKGLEGHGYVFIAIRTSILNER